ncbi:MAG: GIY-YIG nuclease family protein [Patescibacteria group bacterium]
MEYTVYAIKSLKGPRIYVGFSSNVPRRLKEHNLGHVFSTKGYRPWILIYTVDCGNDRLKARQTEKYLKSGTGKEFLKRLTIPE